MNAEAIRVESDERGFELHIDTTDDGTVIVNVQGVAEELFDAVKSSIGPWLQERDAAFAEFRAAGGHPMCPDEDGRCVYGRDETCPRVGDDEHFSVDAFLEAADTARKRAKGE